MHRIQNNRSIAFVGAAAFCLGTPTLASAQNVVSNPSFELGTVPFGTPVVLTTASDGFAQEPSAATNWIEFNRYYGTTTTTLVSTSAVPGPEPFPGGGNEMIHIVTSGTRYYGAGNGIYSAGNMPNEDNASAWMYVVSGEATLFDVEDGGIGGVSYNPIPTGGYATDTTIGQWVQLNLKVKPGSSSHYIEIDAGDWDGNGDPANFYVDLVQSNGASAVPEPGVYALFASLGLTGATFLRRRRAR